MKGKNKMPELSTNVLGPVQAARVTRSRAASEGKKAQQEANTVHDKLSLPIDNSTFTQGTFFADVENLKYSLKNEEN
tara:strand:+ start:1203 stop:1433 length:231 start_codon:yes stop_codon:yes gene_type:complete